MRLSLPSVAVATLYSLLATFTSPYPTNIAFTLAPKTPLSSTTFVPFYTKSNNALFYSSSSENDNTFISLLGNKTDQEKPLLFDPSKCTITVIPSKYGNAYSVFSVLQTSLRSWESVATTEPFNPNSGVHRWAVRIDKSARGHIMLGVMTSMASLDTYIGSNPFSWGMNGNQALWHRKKKVNDEYGEKFGTDSIVVLTLDTSAGTLSYGTLTNSEQLKDEEIVSALQEDDNVEDWGIAFERLPLDTELFPVVSLYQRDDMVTMLDVEMMNLVATSEDSNLLIA